MELYAVGERFFQEFTLRQVLLNRQKPDRAICRWHFQPGGSAPTASHALITHQEHEAWNVLLPCQVQLRLAPSGHAIGIDMDAALGLAAARGCDLAVLSELLPAAEVGLAEKLRSI